MATVDALHNPSGLLGAVITQWLLVPADSVGQVVFIPNHSDKTLDLWGTFGGATASVQGTNDPRAVTDVENAAWKTLYDYSDTAISYTTALSKMPVVSTNPLYLRVRVAGGDGTTSLNFVLCSKRG